MAAGWEPSPSTSPPSPRIRPHGPLGKQISKVKPGRKLFAQLAAARLERPEWLAPDLPAGSSVLGPLALLAGGA